MSGREKLAWIGFAAIALYLLLRRAASSAAAPVAQTGGSAKTGAVVVSAAAPDLSPVVAAIQALGAVPNLQTASRSLSTGTTELVASEGGKRLRVLAYAFTTSGTNTAIFRTGGREQWRLALDAPAGNTGANCATAWPSYLFTGDAGENLDVQVTAACHVSVTYWME